MKRTCVVLIFELFFTFQALFSKGTADNSEETIKKINKLPENLEIIEKAYPDVIFTNSYEEVLQDWKIEITVKDLNGKTRKGILFWCDGRLLPQEELENKASYSQILYKYPKELASPENLSPEMVEGLDEYGKVSNRKKAPGTPMFFYDLIYHVDSRKNLETHIVNYKFLGHSTNVHERMKVPLKNVENKIYKLAETDPEVQSFVEKIKSADAYNWRLIDGTNRKSFHSYGISVDILPKRITGEIYWSWARDKNPSGWMYTPLNKRWLPPAKVVEAFESEGFIWGGKWMIWDNMHFEYRPEIINFSLLADKNN